MTDIRSDMFRICKTLLNRYTEWAMLRMRNYPFHAQFQFSYGLTQRVLQTVLNSYDISDCSGGDSSSYGFTVDQEDKVLKAVLESRMRSLEKQTDT